VDAISESLAAWMPRLLALYRKVRHTRGPSDRLSADELQAVARGVRKLSEGLTRGRRLVGAHYLNDPELLSAYLLYFWPVSYAQGRHVLGEIGARPRTVLDLASGPGPLSLAAFDAGATEVLAADRSEGALDLARTLASATNRMLVTRPWDAIAGTELPGGNQAWSIISLGHVLNELWAGHADRIEKRAALCRQLLGRLRKGGSLVLIEPALQVTTRELLQLRDRLAAEGVTIRAPCLYRGACPALERPADWCHAERAWEPPPALADIVQAAGLHKEALKMAYVIFAPPGEAWPTPPAGRLFRVVSEQLAGKDRLRVMGCGAEGRVPLALADSARTAANEPFVRATRGDILELRGAEPAAEGNGVRVVAATTVRLVRRAGEPISGG
jgi:SAM-dependent methyltransferase